MITINTAEFSRGVYVRFNIPKNGKVVYEYSIARNFIEAKKMMYFRNRKYIYEKLSHWLKQRQHALSPYFKADGYAEKMATIADLRIQVDHLEKNSFWNLCSFVSRKKDEFVSVAPESKSSHYKHYSGVILPILNFCVEMKGSEE